MGQDRSVTSFTYAQAGVDVSSAETVVQRIAALARGTRRPEVLADIGPFAGLFRISRDYQDPVLVASADGVGTKLKLAALLGRYDTLGHDLVNHCVNDILTAGAEPLFFLDYLAFSDLSPEWQVDLVGGLASACRAVNCALLGGETAQMPDIYAPGDFDLAGFIVGVLERDRYIDGNSIKEGDVLLGLAANGLHTNGYSLARRVFGAGVGGEVKREIDVLQQVHSDLGMTLGETLLTPHPCYYHVLKPVLGSLKGVAHITGGGLPGNLPRILPEGLAARLERGSWPVPAIFRLIQEAGQVPEEEMYRTFNMGLGMILAVSPENVDELARRLPEAYAVGRVVRQTDGNRLLIAE